MTDPFGLRAPAMPLSVLPDSHFFDWMMEHHEDFEYLVAQAEAGRLDIVLTHIQVDEIGATPDQWMERRVRLILTMLQTPHRLVPTAVFVVDRSRLNHARLASERGNTVYESIPVQSNHIDDAILAATADYEGIILVTNDRRLRNRCRDLDIPAITIDELVGQLQG